MKAKRILLIALICMTLLAGGCSVYALDNQEFSSAIKENETTGTDNTLSTEYESIDPNGSTMNYFEPDDSVEGIPQEKSENIDEYMDVLLFDSVDEARSHVPFPIALPSVLPDKTELIEVAVLPGIPLSQWLIQGVGLNYRFEVADESWISRHESARIELSQSTRVWYEPQYFAKQYDSAPLITYVDGVPYETMQLKIGDSDAVLGAYNLPVLLGLESPFEDYSLNADFSWCKDGVYYQLHVFAPGESLSFQELLAIAESVGL